SLLYAGQRHLPLRVRVFMDWLAATLQAAFNAGQTTAAAPGMHHGSNPETPASPA
ncbi:MAG: LysR family transcriptional regulator, partial [Pseudomonas sp.]